jgi:hypothetical protein
MELDRRQQPAVGYPGSVSGDRQISSARFAVGVAVMIMAVAFAVISCIERGARSQAMATSGAVPLLPAKRDPSYVASAAEYAFQSRTVDAPDSRLLLPALLVEDLTNAQENAGPDERELVIARLLSRLVEIDSHAAAQFAEHVTEASLREVSLRVVAQSWAHRDAAAATLWAVSLGDAGERGQAISNVALELVQSDPLQAVRLLERQFTADMPAGVLEGVVQQWAEKSYADALAWSATLPPGARRDLVLQRLVFVRANQNPMDAVRLAEEAFADSQKQTDALASIALNWGSRDPMSAREWARTLGGRARERVDAELALLGGTEL